MQPSYSHRSAAALCDLNLLTCCGTVSRLFHPPDRRSPRFSYNFSMYRVKICGITTPGDALLAAEAGADAIGLNFCQQSPRYIDADRAAEIVERLREEYAADQVQVFGVFVNA